MIKEQEIFFHVGLSKTGSTFLQHHVFPFLKGVHYIPTRKYHNIYKILPQVKKEKILISREFDQQFFTELDKFIHVYPSVRVIMVLRKHDSWAVSQLKRFIKNGHPYSLRDFIDIEGDKGRFKIQDFDFKHKIEYLEKKCKYEALLLNYDDLKFCPKAFIKTISEYINAEPNWDKINLNPKHTSYTEHSLLTVKNVSQYISFKKKLEIHRQPVGFIYNLIANLFRYSILHGSKLLPASVFENQELIDRVYLNQIVKFTASDWKFVQTKFKKIECKNN